MQLQRVAAARGGVAWVWGLGRLALRAGAPRAAPGARAAPRRLATSAGGGSPPRLQSSVVGERPDEPLADPPFPRCPPRRRRGASAVARAVGVGDAAPGPRARARRRDAVRGAAPGADAPGPAAEDPSAPSPAASLPPIPPGLEGRIRFCQRCGGPVRLTYLPSDGRWRHVCQSCGNVHYVNPCAIVGCIVEHAGGVLLCRRGIEPAVGRWTIPAGFLESGESSLEGATRETREETGAEVADARPFAHLDIPRIAQSYLVFRGRLENPRGIRASLPETTEVRVFEPHEIPWEKIAFSAVTVVLERWVSDLERGSHGFHHAVIRKHEGAPMNGPGTFDVVQEFRFGA